MVIFSIILGINLKSTTSSPITSIRITLFIILCAIYLFVALLVEWKLEKYNHHLNIIAKCGE